MALLFWDGVIFWNIHAFWFSVVMQMAAELFLFQTICCGGEEEEEELIMGIWNERSYLIASC